MAILRLIFGKREADHAGDAPAACAPPVPNPPAPRPSRTENTQASETPRQHVAVSKTISRPNPRSGRVKSRLMNYGQLDAVLDELEQGSGRPNRPVSRPVGWLVVIEGPGTGAWYTLESGLTRIGRGDSQNICLNFGDSTISRETHVSVAYEPADHRFLLGLGASENDVLVNGSSVRTTIDLKHGDLITVGETTLRLAAFCDDRFSWAPIIDKGNPNVLSA